MEIKIFPGCRNTTGRASAMTLGELTLPRHCSSFWAKQLHQTSEVTRKPCCVLRESESSPSRCYRWCCFPAARSGLHQLCHGEHRGFINPIHLWIIPHGESKHLDSSKSTHLTSGLVKHTESFGTSIGTILTPALLEYSYFQVKSEFWNVNVSGHS